jgi:molecular chaperone GrpE
MNEDQDDVFFEEEGEGVNSLAKDPRVEKLKEKLKKCEAERKEYLDGWQRMRADVINIRKDNEQIRSWAMQAGKTALAEDVIMALDSFDAAFAGASWEGVDKNWRTGIEYIYSQLMRALEAHDIQQFGSVGDVYDPHTHEIAEERPTQNGESDNTIVRVLRKGYKMGDKLLRPAQVVVAQNA